MFDPQHGLEVSIMSVTTSLSQVYQLNESESLNPCTASLRKIEEF